MPRAQGRDRAGRTGGADRASGPRGATGRAGASGPPGASGAAGPRGAVGPTGAGRDQRAAGTGATGRRGPGSGADGDRPARGHAMLGARNRADRLRLGGDDHTYLRHCNHAGWSGGSSDQRSPDRHELFGRGRVRRDRERRNGDGRGRGLEDRLPLRFGNIGHDAGDDPDGDRPWHPGASISSAGLRTTAQWRADESFSAGLAATGGAAGLRDATGALVDGVGWGTATNAFVEGSPAPAPPATSAPGSSIVRLPDGHDTNANAADFTISSTATPKAANH